MDGDRGTEIEMIVESVRVHMPTGRHVLVLRETDAGRLLMVWVGPWEASAIAMKLQGLTPERPLTHDLFATVLTTLDVRIERIVITDLADETYHARLVLNRLGERHEIDARPSDAIALAVRLGVPVYASSDVLDRAATLPDDDDDTEDERRGRRLRTTSQGRRAGDDGRGARPDAARDLPRVRELARRRGRPARRRVLELAAGERALSRPGSAGPAGPRARGSPTSAGAGPRSPSPRAR